MKTIEAFFLQKCKGQDERELRLARLQIKFSVISILFAFAYFANTFITGFIVARYTMVISATFFTIQLFGLKIGISRTITSHLFVLACWGIVFILTLFSLGIDSYVLAWISLIPIMALLLLDNRTAWIWGGLGLCTVVFFYLADQRISLPPQLVHQSDKLLAASLHIGLLFIVLTLTYVFDQQQTLLLSKISELYKEANSRREEMAAQNEELVQSQEEILAQRDLLSDQNVKMKAVSSVIEKQNENLEIEVGKRTHELLEYNRQLEQFAFISSHNLRAPVARILGLGNLLELPSKTSDDEAFIKTNLITAARELDRVVKDLNTILEIRKNNTSVITEIDLSEELNLILINLEKEVKETGAQILYDFSAGSKVQGILPYVDSILINLISNSIKYRHPNRPPVIQIKTKLVGDFLTVGFEDNGLGIDLALHQEKLFTLYSRFHTHVEGKGLGLYLIKSQVLAVGGKIEVESKVNTGTTFTIYFRLNTNT